MSQIGNLPLDQRLDPLSAGISTGLANVFDGWLGPKKVVHSTDPYESRSQETFDMPEAYRGQSYELRDTVIDLMLTRKRQWILKEVAPVTLTDQLSVTWRDWETNAHFLTITPEEAASRLVTQQYEMRRAMLSRYGIGVYFEHGFLNTAMGRQSFVLAVHQVAYSIVETANMLVYRAMLDCHAFQSTYYKRHGVFEDGDYIKYLKRDRDRFGAVQKSKRGLHWIDAQIDEEMHIYRGEADSWIVSPDVINYLRLRRDENTDYYLAGKSGPANVSGLTNRNAAGDSAGPTEMLDDFLPGTPIYILRAMHFENLRNNELLSHRRQIGEYYMMVDNVINHEEYTSEARTISIFNSDENRFSRVTLMMALENCHIFDNNGNVKPVDIKATGGDMTMEDLKHDFLMRRDENGQLKPVRYVGDIALQYFDSKALRKAGRTLVNSLQMTADEKAKMSNLVQSAIQSVDTQLQAGQVVTVDSILSDGTDQQELERFGAKLMTKLEQLSGGKGLVGAYSLADFYELFIVQGAVSVQNGNGDDKGKEEEEDDFLDITVKKGRELFQKGKDAVTRVWESIFSENPEYIPKKFKRKDDPNQVYTLGDETINSRPVYISTKGKRYVLNLNGTLTNIKKDGKRGMNTVARKKLIAVDALVQSFYTTLLAPLPQEHREALREQHVDTEADAMDVAEGIRDGISDLIQSKTKGLKWKNVDAMQSWFNRRVEAFEAQRSKLLNQMEEDDQENEVIPVESLLVVVSSNVSTSSSARVGWALPGQRLPEGWSYKHSYSQTARPKARVGTVIPGSVEHVSYFLSQSHAARSQSSGRSRVASGMQFRGTGMGMAGIGQFQPIGADHGSTYDKPAVGEFPDDLNNLTHMLKALASSASSALVRVAAMGYALLPVNLDTCKALIDEHIVLPMNFVLFKSHIQYKCRAGVKIKRNGGAIRMFMSKGDLQIQHSAKVKTGILHWTGHLGPVVRNPKNCYIQPALMTHDYEGGDGVAFYSPSEYRGRPRNRPRKDIVVAPIPYTQVNLPNPLDVSGRFHAETAGNLLRAEDRQAVHYNTAPRMNALYRFHNPREHRHADDAMGGTNNSVPQNTVCWAGHWFMWNPRAREFNMVHCNTGHRTKNIYPGVADIWGGSKAEVLAEQSFAGYIFA